MFSDKNYGLPKDLIEAAKKVHEKQLEENLDKRIKKPKNKDPDFTKLSGELDSAFKEMEIERKKYLKSEEVQFTEEELAEAFAIFLEENFHVEMLTEEDLDYVFEEEFPQWLDVIVEGLFDSDRKSQLAIMGLDSNEKPKPGSKYLGRRIDNPRARIKNVLIRQRVKRQSNVGGAESGKAKGSARDLPQYLPHRSKIFQGDTEGGNTSAPKSTPKSTPKPTAKPAISARKQVSAKPAASARKPAPKIDYKTPVTRRGPDGTYGLTSKGRKYVARKEAQERKKPFSASEFFSQMQRDGN